MVLNANVLVAEADVAAQVGATLVGATYTIYGISMPQDQFQRIINTTANQEQNELGNTVYQTSDAVLNGAVQAYQIWDASYRIAISVRGLFSSLYAWRVGDSSLEPIYQMIIAAVEGLKAERDRAFNQLQNIMSGNVMIDTDQPGYSQPASSFY